MDRYIEQDCTSTHMKDAAQALADEQMSKVARDTFLTGVRHGLLERCDNQVLVGNGRSSTAATLSA